MRMATHPLPRRGASLVEMALVLPVFMLVVTGIIEFGRAMMVGQLVTNAARHGARLAVIDGATNDSVQASVADFVRDAVGVDPAHATIAIDLTPAPGNPDPADDLSRAQPRDLCKVIVRIPYERVGYVAGRWLRGTQLSGQCTMRHE